MRDLKYLGVRSKTPPNFKTRNRAPLSTDISGVYRGDIWHEADTENLWMLTSKYNNIATWTELNDSGSSPSFTDLTITTGDLTLESGSLILEAINYISTLRTQADGTVVGLADPAAPGAGTGTIYHIDSTGASQWGGLTSTGATVTITTSATGINLEAAGGVGGNSYTTDDLNVVSPTAGGNVFVVGGNNIGTTGAIANTITVNLDDSISLAGDLTVAGAVISYTDFNAQTGTTYQLQLTDVNKIITLSNASAITLTVPSNADVAFPVGSMIALVQQGAGEVTVAAAPTVTIESYDGKLKIDGQYSTALLFKYGINTWNYSGQIA